MRRFLIFSMPACALTACLLSIDESKIETGTENTKRSDSSTTTTTPSVRIDSSTPPQTKDAEAPLVLPDGGRACSEGLTLCPDDVCYDTTGELANCGTCGNVCPANQLCRASKCVPPSSCKELLARAPGTSTGVTNLTIAGTVLPAFCDMTTDGGGYTLVFRLSRGQPGDPYALLKGNALNDDVSVEATPQVRTKHYVSRLLAGWNIDFPVEQVRVRLLNDAGDLLRELSFDGKGTTRESWFSKAKLLTSPWNDVSAADTGFFAPAGHPDEQRRFFIHRPYKTCEEDEGWLVVHGSKAPTVCAYENPGANIRIYYAPNATAHRWSTGVPEASSFAVFVR
ncbi:MAG TPA: fibrinogen-like YCDxxxxGGGW domain-containing protein [Labilithrix sp.]|jgi:hypothetical protein|nr:fibrinogen-like YCDxxxxGGGW domain-containing protein [Labilithrix sp.]